MTELDEIKNRLDIVEYVGKYIPLKQAGRNFKGCCPFHNEKTASFIVSPDKQIWHCFGCNEGGDIISFAEKMVGLDFGEAVKILAERAGVRLPERINSVKKSENDKYFAINEEACKQFEKELQAPTAQKVREYLISRGFTEETIKTFRFGFSSTKGEVLTKHLTLLGYKQEDLVKAGVSGVKNGRYYDWFRGRLMIPIMNQSGKVVAFTARTMEGILPGVQTFGGKYINTQESPIYHKSDILFGFDKAKEQARKQNHLILVEGNMDMIAAFQAGTKNVVATSGTALTESQLNLIKRFTKNIKISFDVDMAGQNATRRAIELAQEKGFNIKVIEVPEGKDPADVIQIDSKKWINACKKAKYVVDYIFDSTFSKYNLNNILEKKQATKELLGVVAKLPDPVEKEHYLNELARKIGVSLQALTDALTKTKVAKAPVKEEKAELITAKKSKKTLEEHVLGLVLVAPQFIDFFFNKMVLEDFRDTENRRIFENLQTYYNNNDDFQIKNWLKSLNKNDNEFLNKLTLQAEDEFADAEEEQLGEELFNAVLRLKKENLKKSKQDLSLQIKQAELGGDKAKLLQFMTEFQKLIEIERNL
jgi:DNA primase